MMSSRAQSLRLPLTGWRLLVPGWIGLALMALVIAASPAGAQERPVGQIDTARGIARPADAVVIRAGGDRTPARSLVRLYDGDRVVVSGANTRLTLFVAGTDTPVPVTRANSPFIVRGRSGGSSGFVGRSLASLDLLFNRPRMAIATSTEARGPGEVLGPDAFLPAGPQRLPAGARPLVVLWAGGASPVQVVQFAQTRTWEASLFTSALIEAPAEGDFEIVLPGDALGWAVARVPDDQIPRVPDAPATQALTPDERLATAVWLIAGGGAEWRLFALSEVADLARSDYGAARLLAAIRAGEIAPEDLAAAAEAVAERSQADGPDLG